MSDKNSFTSNTLNRYHFVVMTTVYLLILVSCSCGFDFNSEANQELPHVYSHSLKKPQIKTDSGTTVTKQSLLASSTRGSNKRLSPPGFIYEKQWITFFFGVLLLLITVALAFGVKKLNHLQTITIRILLSVSVAAIFANIPGILNIHFGTTSTTGNAIYASGVFAIFIILYLKNPAPLYESKKERASTDQNTWKQHKSQSMATIKLRRQSVFAFIAILIFIVIYLLDPASWNIQVMKQIHALKEIQR